MRFSLGMCLQVQFRLEPFCAFHTVKLAETWEILCIFCALVLFEMLVCVDVRVNLIKIARVTPRLLFRVGTTDGRHGDGCQ